MATATPDPCGVMVSNDPRARCTKESDHDGPCDFVPDRHAEQTGIQVENFASLRRGDVVREVNCPACGGQHIVTLTKLGTFTDDSTRRARGQRWRMGWEYTPDCRPAEKGHRAITGRLVTAGWIYLIRAATPPTGVHAGRAQRLHWRCRRGGRTGAQGDGLVIGPAALQRRLCQAPAGARAPRRYPKEGGVAVAIAQRVPIGSAQVELSSVVLRTVLPYLL